MCLSVCTIWFPFVASTEFLIIIIKTKQSAYQCILLSYKGHWGRDTILFYYHNVNKAMQSER